MSLIYKYAILCLLIITTTALLSAPPTAATGRSLHSLVKEQPLILKYHKGPLLKGEITLNFIWIGNFTSSQKSIILDFFRSLNPSTKTISKPSAASWWRTTELYSTGTTTISIGKQIFKTNPSTPKTLTQTHLESMSKTLGDSKSITVILTDKNVIVENFCRICGTHGSTQVKQSQRKSTFIWVGNSETQCPGTCAWPFHQPIYGPQSPPLIPPNGDVGIDGMIINLATLLAGTVTNPFDDGYFMGPKTAPLEAVSACTGIFGSGSYPGYPGKVLTENASGASYNANGVNGRRFLLPAMWDPRKLACSTLV